MSSLKLKKSPKQIITRVVVVSVLLLLATFILKVFVWEQDYYNGMEGSERALSPSVGDVGTSDADFDHGTITEQQKTEYTVAPDKPRYLTIEKLNIYNTRIIEVGTLANGQMGAPNNNYDAGWWTGSDAPGKGGTAILDGHNGVDVRGLFKDLNKLQSGDTIRIELGDGTKLTYRVYDNITYPLEEANKKISNLAISPVRGTESISIVSCTGDWSQVQQTMTERQFLRATLTSRGV